MNSPKARRASKALLAELADGFVALPGGLGTIEEFFEAALDRAASLIEETGASVSAPHVHEQRAELARRRGDNAGRERELHEAHRLYTEMDATGHAERVGRELGMDDTERSKPIIGGAK